MPDFCTCGAQLPPDARFCHKCGKPQFEYPPPETVEEVEPPPLPQPAEAPMEISFRNRTAVRIGFVMALLAIIALMIPGPVLFQILRFFGVFFLAGLLGTFWYVRRTGQRLSMRGGARLGWITGIFSFVLFMIMFTLLIVAVTTPGGAAAFRTGPGMNDPNVQQALKALSDPATAVTGIVATLIMMFILLTTLPMLGGAVGAKLAAKDL